MNPQDLRDEQNPSGPVEVQDIEVIVDRDACIGASACIPPADKTFALDAEGKAVVLASAHEDMEDDIIDAARVCPVQAIKIMKDGKQIA